MSQLRKIILLVFIALYLVVAPLTVLYALGYIFSPAQQTLLQTGLISLSSDPSEARVWLNDTLLRDKTPTILRNLAPGRYTLKVTLPGRHDWQRQVEVTRDRVLRFENVLLFRKAFRPEILSAFPVERLWSSFSARNLLVQPSGNTSQLFLYEPEDHRLHPVFPEGLAKGTLVDSVLLHPLGEEALVTLSHQGTPLPYRVKLLDPIEVISLGEILLPPFGGLRWGLSQKKILYFMRNDLLRAWDLEEGIPTFLLKEKVRGYTVEGRRLYVMDIHRRFLELTEKGKIQTVLLAHPDKVRQVFGPDEGERYSIYFLRQPFLFTPLIDSLVLFLSSRGHLYSNKLPYLLDRGVEEPVPATRHPRALYRKGNEIWVVDFEQERRKAFFEIGPTPRRLYRGKETPRHLQWFYDDRYLLFVEGDRVKVMEWEGEGAPLELLSVSHETPEVRLDERKGELYFIHPANRRLARVKLYEPTGILPRLMDDLA